MTLHINVCYILMHHSHISKNCIFLLLHRYDFAVYGLLSSEIGANFFPKSSKRLQLINSFGVFLAAFLMRLVSFYILFYSSLKQL